MVPVLNPTSTVPSGRRHSAERRGRTNNERGREMKRIEIQVGRYYLVDLGEAIFPVRVDAVRFVGNNGHRRRPIYDVTDMISGSTTSVIGSRRFIDRCANLEPSK